MLLLLPVGENRENNIRGLTLSDEVYSTAKPLRMLKEVADKILVTIQQGVPRALQYRSNTEKSLWMMVGKPGEALQQPILD